MLVLGLGLKATFCGLGLAIGLKATFCGLGLAIGWPWP